jgi:hypothetical protein
MADGSGPVAEGISLLTTYPYVLWSGIALVIFMVVGITSMRAARRMASYETWYAIHLYTYLAIALSLPAPARRRRRLRNDPMVPVLLDRAVRDGLSV